MKYNDFIGTVHYSDLDEVFFGKIEGINDLVTFEGDSVIQLRESFHEAVEDYQTLCSEMGKEPMKSFKDSFNVRINPELHSKLFASATLEGKTLNQFVKEATVEKLMNKRGLSS